MIYENFNEPSSGLLILVYPAGKYLSAFILNFNLKIINQVLCRLKYKSVTPLIKSNYTFLLSLTTDQPDDDQLSAKIHKRLVYNLLTTHLNTGRYDGFKSGGKMETIENDSLKQNILVFYQQTITNVTDLEDFLNSWQLKILNWNVDRNDKLPIKDFVTTEKMKGLLRLGSENFKASIENYNEAIRQARKILQKLTKKNKK